MSKWAGIIFIVAIFAAAEAAPPIGGGKFPSLNWVDTNAPSNPFGALSVKPIAPAVQPKPPSAELEEWEVPAVTKPVPVMPLTKWVSLDSWAAQHGIGKPHLLSDLPVTTYAIGSSNGVMLLEIGSHDATWRGVEIHLGFEPQFIDGRIFLQELDLQKNLEPLLCGPPLTWPQTNRVIVIDPGHGGSNTGTHSVLDGRPEKEFTLDLAKQLAPLLEQEGWKVFLTRTNDTAVSLLDRVLFAEAHHADLFISLHFNSTPDRDKKIHGLETYCLTPTGMPSTLKRNYSDILTENFPNNAFDARNLQLAVRLQSALLRATGLEDRGVCRARFMGVLRRQRRPAVLIEAGFLSSPSDARLIETSSFRQKLAQAIADALKPKSEDGSRKSGAGMSGPDLKKLSWP